MAQNIASNLVGKNVNGWVVIKKLPKPSDATGGSMSSGYVVKNSNGREAFMKVVNVEYTLKNTRNRGRMADVLKELLDDHTYERDLLRYCGENGMDRVVVAIDSGEFEDPATPYFIPYLVFELCREGDLRRNVNLSTPKLAWRLRVFHGVCVGVMQLHKKDIAHQDLKPSNILVFGLQSKVADLGRSTRKEANARFAEDGHCGHVDYMPIELQYSHFEPDWDVRRKGADLYMLGGIMAYLVSNIHIFGHILTKLPRNLHPFRYRGLYTSIEAEVITATNSAISDILASLPEQLRAGVGDLLSILCHPVPRLRGHPRSVGRHNPFSMERIVSAADVLAKKAWVHKL